MSGLLVQIVGSGGGTLQKSEKAPSDETDLPEDGIALLAAGILCVCLQSGPLASLPTYSLHIRSSGIELQNGKLGRV